MGRRIRTTLLSSEENLKPNWPDQEKGIKAVAAAKPKQEFDFDCRNGVSNLPSLSPRDTVLMRLNGQKHWTTPAVVQGPSSTSRSNQVETA